VMKSHRKMALKIRFARIASKDNYMSNEIIHWNIH